MISFLGGKFLKIMTWPSRGARHASSLPHSIGITPITAILQLHEAVGKPNMAADRPGEVTDKHLVS
jgi:hypothetical protein